MCEPESRMTTRVIATLPLRSIRRRALGTTVGVAAVCLVAASAGCQTRQKVVTPVVIPNRDLGPMTIAVAPALNQSGSVAFDPNRFADHMASELSYAEGVRVVPVSRVLAALSAQGVNSVESPEHALELTRLLGVDAILVFSVTEYDPHVPPSIGITGQLYGQRPGPRRRRVDPVALYRQPGGALPSEENTPAGLLRQTQRVFDAAHDQVVSDVRAFAANREGDSSPYGWRIYVVSQQHFIRYCCHATIRAMLAEPPPAVPAGQSEG